LGRERKTGKGSTKSTITLSEIIPKKTRETFQSIKSFVKCRGAFPLGRPGAPGIQIAGTLLESPLPGIAGSTFLQFSTKGAKDMEARLHRNRRQIDENKRVGKDGNTCKKNVHE